MRRAGFCWVASAAIARTVIMPGLIATLTLLGGCGSSPPSAFYTLTPMVDETPGEVSARPLAIGLGPFSFPRFLDRPQVVRRQDSNQLVLDEFNRWGGSLDDDFPRVFSENLGRALHTSRIVVFPSELRLPLDFRVTAEVMAFEAGPSDQAMLRVRWAVLEPTTREVLHMRESVYRRSLPPAASVSVQITALSATLADFSRDVADELRRLPRSRPLERPAA